MVYKKAQNIMDYDNMLWNKLGVRSRTEMDEKGLYPKYISEMKKKFKKPLSRNVMRILENENYHSAYEAIGYK